MERRGLRRLLSAASAVLGSPGFPPKNNPCPGDDAGCFGAGTVTISLTKADARSRDARARWEAAGVESTLNWRDATYPAMRGALIETLPCVPGYKAG